MFLVIRQQIIGIAANMHVVIALHNQTGFGSQAHGCGYAQQVFHLPFSDIIRNQHDASAVFKIRNQHVRFVCAKITLGRIDDDGIRILRYCFSRNQRKTVGFDVVLLNVGQNIFSKFAFAVTGQGINLGQVVTGDIMDGVGQLIFTIEFCSCGIVVGIVIHIIAGYIDVIVANQTVSSFTFHQHGIGIELHVVQFIAVQEGRLLRRINIFHLDVIAQTLIAVQQAGDGVILVAIGSQQIELYILVKAGSDTFGLI